MKNVYNTMRVLSLFDGMSCGQIALKEIGITPEVYLGDVRDLNVENLGHIDLILAGSPCTDMSFSGKRKGLSTVEGITWRFQNKKINPYRVLQVTDCTKLV